MKHSLTRNLAALTLFLFPAAASAAPATVTGPTALALAAVVAQHSSLPAYDKRVMARLLAGDSIFFIAAKTKVSVTADTIECRTSNVDITARSCELTFKTSKKTVKGREANELYATAATAGVAARKARPDRTSSFEAQLRDRSQEVRQRPAAARPVRSRPGIGFNKNGPARRAGPTAHHQVQFCGTGSSFASCLRPL